jgi:hypothetical protein
VERRPETTRTRAIERPAMPVAAALALLAALVLLIVVVIPR